VAFCRALLSPGELNIRAHGPARRTGGGERLIRPGYVAERVEIARAPHLAGETGFEIIVRACPARARQAQRERARDDPRRVNRELATSPPMHRRAGNAKQSSDPEPPNSAIDSAERGRR
jgi:hypothetical protein